MSLHIENNNSIDRKILDDYNIWNEIYPIGTIYLTIKNITGENRLKQSDNFMKEIFNRWYSLCKTEENRPYWVDVSSDYNLGIFQLSWEPSTENPIIDRDPGNYIHCWERRDPKERNKNNGS